MLKRQTDNNELAGHLLKAALDSKQRRNKAYSSRALARDLNISPSYLNMVINGKKQLSFETALRIIDRLDLKGKNRSRFLRSVVVENLSETTTAEEVRTLLFSPAVSNGFVSIDQDRFEFFSNWYHVAILDLTACAGFDSDPDWIANALGIGRSLVCSSIDRLLRLGLLQKDGGNLIKTNLEIAVTPTRTDPAIRKFHTQMIEKAKEALQSAESADYDRRSISGITMAVDSRRIEEARKRIALFRREMYELLAADDSHPDEVYQLNVQLFPLSKNGKREE